jgi:hypothetical protein
MDEPEQSIEARIQARAYEIWEREGRPHGSSDDHWFRARVELEAEAAGAADESAQAAKPAKPRRGRSKAAPSPADLHPGMMGDSTEEQNLNQTGNPAARIGEDEVRAAFKDA